MDKNDLDKKLTSIIQLIAETILEMTKEGYSKEQILDYFIKIGELSREDGATTDLISSNVDIISRAIDRAIFFNDKPDLQNGIKKLYQQMVDEKKLSYIGKDGKDYYSREALENANRDYLNNIYTENETKTR